MLKQLALFVTFSAALAAQTNPASVAAHKYRVEHESQILSEFSQLLSIPNIASDKPNIRRNADTIAAALTKRGVAAQLVEIPGANPVVYGEIKTPGATRTIALYAHYDGQPLDPKEWAIPPFEPVIKDGRIWARSAGDDKAPIVAMLTALDAIRGTGLRLHSNIRFVFEGEEEAGSIHLEQILASHRDLFTADVWLICDGPVAQNGQQLINFGARGIATVDITLYGPRRELHSGHYGNWAPNPAMAMAHLLASMKDDNGRVLVEGFYDGIAPLGDVEKRALSEAPLPDADLMKELWLGSTEGAPKRLVELLQQPSLNIRGMASSRTGAQASNVIPATATASIDMRLVKGMDNRQTVARLIEHIRKQGYFVTRAEPSEAERTSHARVARVVMKEGGYNAVRTPMDLPISQEVIRVAESARGPVVKFPTSGGSTPLEMIERAVGTRTINVPIANYDDNQHSFNENIKIENLWNGIDLMAALITM